MSAKLKQKQELKKEGAFRNLELNPEEVKLARENALRENLNVNLTPDPQLMEQVAQKRTENKHLYSIGRPPAHSNKKLIQGVVLGALVLVGLYIIPKRVSSFLSAVKATSPKVWSAADYALFQRTIVSGDPAGLDLAYAWNNVQRTPFDASLLDATEAEKNYLSALFKITDQGVMRRIWVMSHVYGQVQAPPPPQIHLQTINDISNLTPPASLQVVHDKIIMALKIQDAFFNDFKQWSQLSSDARVKGSDLPLREAYSLLLATFSNAHASIKGSFYSHLCALSLI